MEIKKEIFKDINGDCPVLSREEANYILHRYNPYCLKEECRAQIEKLKVEALESMCWNTSDVRPDHDGDVDLIVGIHGEGEPNIHLAGYWDGAHFFATEQYTYKRLGPDVYISKWRYFHE